MIRLMGLKPGIHIKEFDERQNNTEDIMPIITNLLIFVKYYSVSIY
jgi:hypothetical protein